MEIGNDMKKEKEFRVQNTKNCVEAGRIGITMMRSFGNRKGADMERLTEVELRSTESGAASSTRGTQVDVQNLHYSVETKAGMQHILRDVSFHVAPDELCAIMGPSGAGKSTLLDLIADRIYVGTWSGHIYINKMPRSNVFNRDCAYVRQDDVHIGTLTVEETLQYAAWTRMPEGTTSEQRSARVNLILDMLNLDIVRCSRVGDAMCRGISGGQLKRLSIGVEIIHLPRLLFLDEPTSGLDSTLALEVMQSVQRLTRQRTCLATIHQPSPDVYSLFDRTILLLDGKVIYSGPAESVVEYFSLLQYSYDDTQNPAEFVVDVITGKQLPEKQAMPPTAEAFQTAFLHSQFYESPIKDVSELPPTSIWAHKHATRKFTQLCMLLHRNWISTIRNRADMDAVFSEAMIFGIIIGIVFFGQGDVSGPFYKTVIDDHNGKASTVTTTELSNMMALMYFVMMNCLLTCTQAIPYLTMKEIIYRRELESFAYSASPYWLASCFTQLPILMARHFVFTIFIYFMCQFPLTAEYYFYFYFVLLISYITSFYYAQFLASWTGSAVLAFSIYPVTFDFLSVFSGFSIQIDELPDGWVWAPYISYARWVYQGLMINYFEREGKDGDEVLEDYSYDEVTKGQVLLILLANMTLIAVATYVTMRPKQSLLQYTTKAVARTEETENRLHDSLLEERQSFERNTIATTSPTITQNHEASGCEVVFRDITYSVTSDTATTTILSNVSGCVSPGEMCALMGSSGAGKSTLLDIIAGRKSTGNVSGTLLFNGHVRTPAIQRSSAYVMQDNLHISVLTVRETLLYAVLFRLPASVDHATKQKRVDKILDMLNLTPYANAIVGGAYFRGISGGQMKRLSIGVEIINLPDLIFLDEPTTGLDSTMSYEVMVSVRNLANQHRTVLCTIHQPSRDLFKLFDKIILLSNGRCLYFGDISSVLEYFSDIYDYNKRQNPADFIISIATGDAVTKQGDVLTVSDLAEMYQSSSHAARHNASLQITEVAVLDEEVMKESAYRTDTYTQIHTICHREYVKMIRMKSGHISNFVRHILMSLFWSTIYYKLDTGYDSALYTTREALLYFTLVFMFIGHMQSIPALFENRAIFYRERSAGAYGALPYWISLWLPQIPLIAMNTFCFCVIIYFMADLREGAEYFFYYCAIVFLTSVASLFMSFSVAAMISSFPAAMNAFSMSLFCTIMFAGFTVAIPDLPVWLGSWAPYLSFIRYGYQGLVLNEFKDNSELPLGQEEIDSLGFDDFDKFVCVRVLVLFTCVLSVVLLAALKWINFERR